MRLIFLTLIVIIGGSVIGQNGQQPAEDKNNDPYQQSIDTTVQIGGYIRRIYQDRTGIFWFGTNDFGVCRFDGKNFSYLTTDDGLGGNQIKEITEDDKGNIWLATSGGVSRYNGTSIHTYTTVDGLSANDVCCLSFDQNGKLWAGTIKGVCCFEGERFVPFPIPSAPEITNKMLLPEKKAIWSIFSDSQGNVWFATNGAGVSRYDGKKLTTFTVDSGLCSDYIQSITEDSHGNIWFSSLDSGVSFYNGSGFTGYNRGNGLTTYEGWYITNDSKGDIWFTDERNGVYKFDGHDFTNYGIKDSLDIPAVQTIFEDKQGNIWFGGGGGIFYYDGQRFIEFNKKSRL